MALEDMARKVWRRLFQWRKGDKVKVIDPRSSFYGRVGTIRNIFKTVGTNRYGVKLATYITFGTSRNYEYFYENQLERVSNECK